MQYCYHNWETDIETALLSNLQTFQILPVFLLFQMFSNCCQFAHYKKILALKPKEKKCYFLAQDPLRITLSRWLFLSCWSPESGIFPPSFFGFHDLDIFEDRPFILSDGSICVHVVFPHSQVVTQFWQERNGSAAALSLLPPFGRRMFTFLFVPLWMASLWSFGSGGRCPFLHSKVTTFLFPFIW